MRKRDIIAERFIFITMPFFYWIGYSLLKVLPDLKSIVELAMTPQNIVSMILWFFLSVVSDAVLRQGVYLFDKNDNEGD